MAPGFLVEFLNRELLFSILLRLFILFFRCESKLYLDPLHYFLYTVSLVDILSLFQTQDLVNLQHHVIREKKLAEKETLVIFYNVIQVR